ncbi:MAG: hypothetical protein AAF298_26935 [Cyanobacteria bacterium P01_A01_bin.40]
MDNSLMSFWGQLSYFGREDYLKKQKDRLIYKFADWGAGRRHRYIYIFTIGGYYEQF